MKGLILISTLSILFVGSVIGQVRPVDRDSGSTYVNVPDAPPSVPAKYQGGMFGFSEKQNGTIRIDDVNKRVVFYGNDQKEKFALAYTSIHVVSPQSKEVTSNTGNVVRHIPLPGSFLGGLIKEKWRYLVITFEDPDVDVSGNVNFKISSKELLESVIKTIGTKAGMTQRGDAYYRPRVAPKREI
jgi:hypothetical protein